MEHRPQSPGRGLERREEELHRPAMVEWIPVEGALMKARGGMDELEIRVPLVNKEQGRPVPP